MPFWLVGLAFPNHFGTVLSKPESEFNEFEPRLKSPKNRFQLIASLNLETQEEPTIIELLMKYYGR